MLGVQSRFVASLFFVLFFVPAFSFSAEAEVNLLDYDIRDIREFIPKEFPQANVLLSSMEKSPKTYFPENVGLENVWGLEIQKIWDARKISVVAFLDYPIRDGVRERFFRFMTIHFSHRGNSVSEVEIEKDVPLRKTHWSVRVGLIQRKVILEEAELGLKKIYPIGVGGFDEGVTRVSHGRTRLNTPRYQEATLRRTTAIAARTVPEYYEGLPFIPISRRDGKRTPYSFHIHQGDPDLERGFISHGCMQLRERNLNELYTILRWGALEEVPINVYYFLRDQQDHPYPLLNDSYATVHNCAEPGEAPHPCADPDLGELLLLVEVEEPPPVSSLVDIELERPEIQHRTAP